MSEHEPNCDMTEDEAKRKIGKSRSQLLLNYPMFGFLANHLKLKEVPEEYLEAAGGAMGTDGHNLIYPREFIEDNNVSTLQAIIAHEVMHLGLGHLWRMDERIQFKWNLATDYTINNMLDDEGLNIEGGLINHDYDGMSAEEIYSLLPDPPSRGSNPPKCPKCGSDNVTKKKLTIDENGKGKAEFRCDDCGHEWEEEVLITEDKRSCGKSAVPWEDVEDRRPDSHETWEDVGKQDENIDEELTGQEARKKSDEMEQEWKRRLVQSKESAKMQGNVPAGMERMIEDLTEPKLDWRSLLRKNISHTARNDYTYTRPKERYDVVYPTLRNPEIKVAIGIDTSGSVSEKELSAFLSEITGIASSYDKFEILLMAGDTQVENIETATSISDIQEFSTKVKGGGGTSYIPFFERAKDEGDYSTLIIIGDSYGSMPEENEYKFNTIWCFDERDYKEPNFGDIAIIDLD